MSWTNLFGGSSQPTRAQQLEAQIQQLRKETEAAKQETAALKQRFLSGGSPAEQARAVGQATTERQNSAVDTTIRAATGMQPVLDAGADRAIRKDTAATDNDIRRIQTTAGTTGQLLGQFQEGEAAARNWITGPDTPLITALGNDYLRRTGGSVADLMRLESELNKPSGLEQFAQIAGPLAAAALAFS